MRFGQQGLATLATAWFAALSAAAGLLPSCTYSRVANEQAHCTSSHAFVSEKKPESRRTDAACTTTIPQTPVPVPASTPPELKSESNELTQLRKRENRLERNYEIQQELDRRIDAEVPRIDAGD